MLLSFNTKYNSIFKYIKLRLLRTDEAEKKEENRWIWVFIWKWETWELNCSVKCDQYRRANNCNPINTSATAGTKWSNDKKEERETIYLIYLLIKIFLSIVLQCILRSLRHCRDPPIPITSTKRSTKRLEFPPDTSPLILASGCG